MLLTILLAAVQTALAPAAPAPAADLPAKSPVLGVAKACPTTIHQADQTARAVARRLDQLPAGRLELTVQREVDGCPIPAVLREGIGGRPEASSGR